MYRSGRVRPRTMPMTFVPSYVTRPGPLGGRMCSFSMESGCSYDEPTMPSRASAKMLETYARARAFPGVPMSRPSMESAASARTCRISSAPTAVVSATESAAEGGSKDVLRVRPDLPRRVIAEYARSAPAMPRSRRLGLDNGRGGKRERGTMRIAPRRHLYVGYDCRFRLGSRRAEPARSAEQPLLSCRAPPLVIPSERSESRNLSQRPGLDGTLANDLARARTYD